MAGERYAHEVILGRFVVQAPRQVAGSPYWYVRIRDTATGRQYERSTRERTRRAARQWAIDWCRSRVAAELRAVEPVKFRDAIRQWIDSRDSAQNTRRSLLYAERVWLSYWGRIDVCDLSGRHLQDFLADLRKKGRKPGTIRNHFSRIRSFARWARVRGWIADDPTAGIALPRGGDFRARVLEPDEVRALLASALAVDQTRVAYLATLVGIYTGLRRTNVLGLLWSDVDLEQRRIDLPAERMKARKPHSVPIHRVVAEEIGQPRGEYVLGRRSQEVKHWWRKVIADSGVGPCRYHDLRGSLATWLRRTVPIDVVSAVLGHAPSGVTGRYYARVDWDEIRAAIDSLQDLRK